MDERTEFRTGVLRESGASASEIQELLAYNGNVFDRSNLEAAHFPLPDERFVSSWERYAREVSEHRTFSVLAKYLVQLRFPIEQNISKTADYLAATRQGKGYYSDSSLGLKLQAPDRIHLSLHSTPAGRIPVIVACERADFETLVRALARRNEPVTIPASMGACVIAGYVNWERALCAIEAQGPQALSEPASYQDRFILLSRGFYSGVTPAQIGVGEEAWRELSLAIRKEHECTHYFTRRVFSSMRNNVLDEIMADYCGIVAAAGHFNPDWMLLFFGLENYPHYRPEARLENYRGNPPLSQGAMVVLHRLVKRATENLATLRIQELLRGGNGTFLVRILTAFSATTLEDLASPEYMRRIDQDLNASEQPDATQNHFQDRRAQVCDLGGNAHA